MKKKGQLEDGEEGVEKDFFLNKYRRWLEEQKKKKKELDAKKQKVLAELSCPLCKENLVVKEIKDVKVFCCDSCQGGWLEEKSLEILLQPIQEKDEQDSS